MSKIEETNSIIKEIKELKIILSKDISDAHHTFGKILKNSINWENVL